jgi:hypothetical protein
MRRERYGIGGFRPEHPSGGLVEAWDDVAGYTRWDDAGVVIESRPLTPEERAVLTPDPSSQILTTCRTALSDALALADLYPAPTPEETAIIDAQVNAALAGFRALDNPPADVVALAAAVVSWRTEV